MQQTTLCKQPDKDFFLNPEYRQAIKNWQLNFINYIFIFE